MLTAYPPPNDASDRNGASHINKCRSIDVVSRSPDLLAFHRIAASIACLRYFVLYIQLGALHALRGDIRYELLNLFAGGNVFVHLWRVLVDSSVILRSSGCFRPFLSTYRFLRGARHIEASGQETGEGGEGGNCPRHNTGNRQYCAYAPNTRVVQAR